MLENKMVECSTGKDKNIGSKVFVFVPPRFDATQITLEKDQVKRKCFDWKISQFDIDLSSTQPESKRSRTLSNNYSRSLVQSNESNEESEINLEYDCELIRNSVLVYLDNTFSENSIQVEASQEFISETYSDSTNTSSDTCRTVQQEFESSLLQSQKLLGESQGFIEMAVSVSQKFQHTTNSQKVSTQSNTLSLDSSSSCGDHENKMSVKQTFSSSFSKLASCNQNYSKVNIFAVVLQVNPIKEILVKSGMKSGQHVCVSSILIGDSTKEYFKLTFWHKAAAWVDTLVAGDFVVVKNIKIEKWQNEFYGQSMYDTTLVNLQKGISGKIPPNWLTFVSKREAKSLMSWLNFRHRYLAVCQRSATCKEVKWQTLPQFTANTLVHYRAKIVEVLTYNSSIGLGSYKFGSRKVNKVVAIAMDRETSEEVPICLWANQADWQYDLKAKIGQEWDFRFLYVECKGIHGDLILNTMPQSTKSAPQPSSVFHASIQHKEPPTFSCISDLLKANYNGKVYVFVNIINISIDEALVDRNPVLSINKTSGLETVVRFFRQLVYLGCKSCLQALQQDNNCIYTRCSDCLKNPSSYTFGMMYCYKQCTITFSDLSASIFATSCHKATAHLVKGFDPQDVLEGTCSDKLYESLCNIFSADCKPKVCLNCETKLDENSFVVKQTFEFIDLYL